MIDVVHTVAIFSTVCNIGNVTVGPEEWTSSPEHALKVAIGLVTVSCPVLSMMGLVCVWCPVSSERVVLRMTNLDVDGNPDGDEMAMVDFVAVFGTFAFISTFFRDVRVVLGATNLDVDWDPDADGFVAVLGTFAFIPTFFGDVRVVLCATNLDVDGDPHADGDKMAMVEFVAVFGTVAFISTYFGDVGQDLFSTRISSPDSVVQIFLSYF